MSTPSGYCPYCATFGDNCECCMHSGEHCAPIKCPDCGRFSSHSWDTGGYSTQNGWSQSWGGTCSEHGEWSDSAA